jgi:AhpD family alkylhydroperoxidase
MTDFRTYDASTAPAASKPLLEKAKAAYGFVPNLLGTMAEAPAILEGYMTLSGIFDKTDFSETERQIILMTNNRLNGCEYCMAAHTSISQMAKVPADIIEALRTNTPIADAKLEALRTFAGVINERRGWPSDAEIEAFLAAGYTRQHVLEVILGTSLKVMSNYTNHIAQTEIDDAFAPNAWSADQANAA